MDKIPRWIPEKGDFKTIISIIIPLFTFCGVFTMQILNGIQENLFSIFIIVISGCIFIAYSIFIRSYTKIHKWNGLRKWGSMLILMICVVFILIGTWAQFYEQEVTFAYPQNGDPIPMNISLSGYYRNVDNSTYIWIYTYSDHKYFVAIAEKIPNGRNSGYWQIENTNIGSINRSEEGGFFTLGFLLVDKSENEYYINFTRDFSKHGNASLPNTHAIKLDNTVNVFRVIT